MATVQMNTRIDAALKAHGDTTLTRFGKTPSDAVRALWSYLAEEQTIPDFMLDSEAASDEGPLAQAVAEGAGMAMRLSRECGLKMPLESLSSEDFRDMAFANKYAAYIEG
ncbi:MAG: type II toxin-antitoxin system RelB/DinJ family antitoxin [Atopobiaceae bacterium]|nr:type II toxin-antitoxin system RelB/DinJ family antitoxin [Atopobiaceae bacterium]